MLTLQFVPYHDVAKLGPNQRISKLMGLVKKNKIVLMQGRLKAVEEAILIEKTMREVTKEFKGIELCTVFPQKEAAFLKKFFMKMFVGDVEGFTIIGPASIVKDIKRNPDKVELLLAKTTRKRNGKK